MEFEEMQAIWDSQNGQLTYSLDAEALHRRVKRKGLRVQRDMNLNDWGMILICLGVAGERLVGPLLHQQDYHNFLAVAVMLGVAVWIFLKRQQRLRKRTQFAPTLLGDLDRALFEAEQHLQMGRTFQWWFLLPTMAILVFEFVMNDNETPLSQQLALVIPALILAMVVVRLGLRCKQIPVKRHLQSLRDTLTSEG